MEAPFDWLVLPRLLPIGAPLGSSPINISKGTCLFLRTWSGWQSEVCSRSLFTWRNWKPISWTRFLGHWLVFQCIVLLGVNSESLFSSSSLEATFVIGEDGLVGAWWVKLSLTHLSTGISSRSWRAALSYCLQRKLNWKSAWKSRHSRVPMMRETLYSKGCMLCVKLIRFVVDHTLCLNIGGLVKISAKSAVPLNLPGYGFISKENVFKPN